MRVRLVGPCEADYAITGNMFVKGADLSSPQQETAEVIDFPGSRDMTTEVCAAA